MRRQGILRTAAAGILVLSLLVAPAVFAADAGAGGGPFGFWTSIQSWMQNVLGDVFGTSQTQVEYKVAPAGDLGLLPCGEGQCPAPEDSVPGGNSESDAGSGADPDG